MYEVFGVIKYYYKSIDLHFSSRIPPIALLFVALCGATTAALNKDCGGTEIAPFHDDLRKNVSEAIANHKMTKRGFIKRRRMIGGIFTE